MREEFFDSLNCAQCQYKCIFSELVNENDPRNHHHIREIIFRKGEVLYKQGAFGSKIIYIKEGLVKLFMEGDNKNLLVIFYTPAMYLGLNQLNKRNVGNYTTVAMKDTKVCMMEINYFKKQFQTNEKHRDFILNLLAFENELLRNRLLVIGTRNNLGRLANTLLYLAEDELTKEEVYRHINRRDIADLSNMSIESLERLLTDLKKEGIIKIKGKSIEIIDVKKINELSRIG